MEKHQLLRYIIVVMCQKNRQIPHLVSIFFVFMAGIGADLSALNAEWTGASNTDWSNARNWKDGILPTDGYNVTIPDVANDPEISSSSSDLRLNSLTIKKRAGLVTNVNLTVGTASGGGLTLSGTLNAKGGSNIILQGTTALEDDGNDLSLNIGVEGGTLDINGTISISGSVYVLSLAGSTSRSLQGTININATIPYDGNNSNPNIISELYINSQRVNINQSIQAGKINIIGSDINCNAHINSPGDIIVYGQVNLLSDLSITTNSGAVTLGHTFDGAQSLRVNTGTAGGSISVNGVIGGTVAPTAVILTSAAVNLGARINSSGNITVNGPVILTSDQVYLASTTTTATEGITLSSTIDSDTTASSNFTLNVQRGKSVSLSGNVGGNRALGDLTIALGTTLETNNHSVNITGSLTGAGILNANDNGANITVSGNLSIANVQTGTNNSPNITVGGNFSVNNFTPGNSTVILNGNSNINLAGRTFYNLTISKNAGIEVTLNENMNVTGNLRVNSGTLSIGNIRKVNNVDITGNMIIAGDLKISNGSLINITGNWNNLITGTMDLTGSNTINVGQAINSFNNNIGSFKAGDSLITAGASFAVATLEAGASSITVGANFAVDNFTPGTSTVTLNEDSASSSLESSIFHNLVVNKTAADKEVNVQKSFNVTGALELKQGMMKNATPNTESFDITFLGSNLIIGANGSFDIGALPDNIIFMKNNSNGDRQSDIALNVTGVAAVNYKLSKNIEINNSQVTVEKKGTGTGSLNLEWEKLTIESTLDSGEDVSLLLKEHRGSTFKTTGLMELQKAQINFTDWNFEIADLNNTNGTIKLTGEQSTQIIPDFSDPELEKYGRIIYSGATGNSTIRIAKFWNLEIDVDKQKIDLNNDITVYGYSTPELGAQIDNNEKLNGIRLKSGELNANEKKFIVYGSYINTGIKYVETANDAARLHFRGNKHAYVAGDNTFLEFVSNVDDDNNVGGKILFMESGKTLKILSKTIAGASVARGLSVKGGQGATPSPITVKEREDRNASFPGSKTKWIYMVASNAQSTLPNADDKYYWKIDLQDGNNAANGLENVYIMDSKAVKGFVYPYRNVIANDVIGWLSKTYVLSSQTSDSDNDGRIDRIIVTLNTDYDTSGEPFAGVEIVLEGYKVDNITSDEGNVRSFFINLQESKNLDTGQTPYWHIRKNTSLADPYGRPFELDPLSVAVKLNGQILVMTPEDKAEPVLAYTLAKAGKNEIFAKFSEPVVKNDGNEIDKSNLSTAVSGGVQSLEILERSTVANKGKGVTEILLKTQNSIAANDILAQKTLTLTNIRDIKLDKNGSPMLDGSGNAVGNNLKNPTHRISDLALGIINPFNASSAKFGLPSEIASTNDFTGKGQILRDGITIKAKELDGITYEPKILYESESKISDAFRNEDGLWLGGFSDDVKDTAKPGFTGLVPKAYVSAHSIGKTSSKGSELTYKIEKTDKAMEESSKLDFIMYWPGTAEPDSGLYSVRILDDSRWYREFGPWKIAFKEVKQQAGGVTILNNIINPNKNEKTYLVYDLSESGTVTIQVFDLSGDMVSVLQKGYQKAGNYNVSWDGRNKAGSVVARGIYFVRYVGPGGIDQIRKVLVVK